MIRPSFGNPLPSRIRVTVFLLFALFHPVTVDAQSVDSLPPPGSADALQPGDVIRVQVWREPDLSGEFVVDESGVVVLPKLGSVTVTGRRPAALKDSLLAGYSTYLRNPSIELTFLRRITIGGAVRNPGLYTVDPSVTLPEALALAGGVSGAGKTNQVELVRGEERTSIRTDQPLAVNAAALRSGDQLVVPERSWLSRNPWVVAAAVTSTAGILRFAFFD